ncbi:unnamed protein product [Caenorhabditis auriculariae]|uniref:Sulfotransferase domain-containing protein n=1 Tax=Caenorhabditis auriculariae TaxID=2777116 RepID=A0A8S1HME6_9PELO|nr:unnamed protein product [Caenorhabditis auriculariae]
MLSARLPLLLLGLTAFLSVQLLILVQTDRRYEGPRRPTRIGRPKLPTALIIGARKGGTRALLDGIALHPKVRIVRRETHFFDANYTLGVEWYTKLMPKVLDDEIIIEKTPAYFSSEVAPHRVFELNQWMKLVIIVRHPTQRAISDFTQVYHNKLDLNKTLPDLKKEAFRRTGGDVEELNTDYKPIRNSLYDVHMSNWLKYFPLRQFLILNGDVFRANPLRELRRLETFLDLEPRISPTQLVFNPRKRFFCFRRDRSERCLGESKGRRHQRVDATLQSRLTDAFRPHNAKFFALVNRTFLWD